MSPDILDPKFLLQLLVVVVTVIISVWRSTTRMQHRIATLEADYERLTQSIATEIARLATAVEKQNGYVRQHGESISDLAGRTKVTERLIDALVKRESDREMVKTRPT